MTASDIAASASAWQPGRRAFLGFLGASALAACAGDDGSGTSPETTQALVDLPGDPFTLGVASGDPLADSVILWTLLLILADFFVLDTRQYRTDQVCSEPFDLGPACDDVDDPANSLLGPEQKSRLTDGLAARVWPLDVPRPAGPVRASAIRVRGPSHRSDRHLGGVHRGAGRARRFARGDFEPGGVDR